jgi:hypothetical protein
LKEIYAVTLDNCNRRKPKKDKLIIRARSKELAIAHAKKLSVRVTGKCAASAHVADPVHDLDCQTKEQVFAMYDQMRLGRIVN